VMQILHQLFAVFYETEFERVIEVGKSHFQQQPSGKEGLWRGGLDSPWGREKGGHGRS
jgi:hypothetical protein